MSPASNLNLLRCRPPIGIILARYFESGGDIDRLLTDRVRSTELINIHRKKQQEFLRHVA
jgi:hypothetical protein